MNTAFGAPARGFTMVELLIGLAALSVLVAVGVPRMNDWVQTGKATAVPDFYSEGIRLARQTAILHNSASRFTLSENAVNHQYDWRVDICFPTPGTPCSDISGDWSSSAKSAALDPETTGGYKSVSRSAAALPSASVLAPSLTPATGSAIYFTPVGWVDTNTPNRLTRISLTPSAAKADQLPTRALVISLAGLVNKCEPAAPAHDARRCPP